MPSKDQTLRVELSCYIGSDSSKPTEHRISIRVFLHSIHVAAVLVMVVVEVTQAISARDEPWTAETDNARKRSLFVAW